MAFTKQPKGRTKPHVYSFRCTHALHKKLELIKKCSAGESYQEIIERIIRERPGGGRPMIFVFLAVSPMALPPDPYLLAMLLCGLVGVGLGYYVRRRREKCL